MSDQVRFVTPVGRLVQGHPFEEQTTDAENRPLTIKTGANAGQPRVDYFMALAIAKTDSGWPALLATIMATAKRDFPTLFDPAGNCLNPAFAFKMVDGDSTVPNTKKVKPCDREGFPGHYVLYLSSGYAPKVYDKVGADYREVLDPTRVKRGDYIRISGSVVGNGATQQPGVFLNHGMVELIGHGEEIIVGARPDVVFGEAPVGPLPAGCSPTPVATGAPPLGGPAAAGFVPPAGVTPAPEFLQGAPAQTAPGASPPAPPVSPAPPPPPTAEARRLAPDGQVYTEMVLLANGYTEAQVNGLPVAP